MFENMEKLEIINVLYGISSLNKQFTNRQYHALIFKINGESEYTFSSKKITLSEGQVLFIPQGENYTVRKISKNESRYALINSISLLPESSPTLYHCNDFDEVTYLIDRMIKTTIWDDLASRFETMSLFFKIVSILYQNNRKNYCDSSKKNLIKPAIEYLENNIFNPSLNVSELHKLCCISDTYFRKNFVFLYGVAPKKYIQNKRLIQAKKILDSGEYDYIYEVANNVGFSDALYFSKLFKTKYGYFPSEKSVD